MGAVKRNNLHGSPRNQEGYCDWGTHGAEKYKKKVSKFQVNAYKRGKIENSYA